MDSPPVQRLPNGNTLIGWGAASATGGPVLTEVHPDKSVAYELFFPLELASYRAFKYPWVSGLPSASVTRYEIFEGNTYEFNDPGDTTAVKIKFNSFQSILYNSVNVKLYDYAPKNPVFDGIAPVIYPQRFVVTPFGIDSLNVDIYFQLNHFPNVDNPNDIIVYERPNEDTGTFIPLITIYNSNTNELKVSSTTKIGEFILGYPDVPVGVEELVGLPENFKLEQNYPNPFNPSTKIRYSLPVASNVTIKIYNTIGENVATLVDAYHSVGNYEVNWNAAFYVSGILFIGGNTFRRKPNVPFCSKNDSFKITDIIDSKINRGLNLRTFTKALLIISLYGYLISAQSDSSSYLTDNIKFNNPSEDYLFLGLSTGGTGNQVGSLLIVDNELTPVFYRKVEGTIFDFKFQPDGELTYNIYPIRSYGMDSSGTPVNQFYTPAGITFDIHELCCPTVHIMFWEKSILRLI